MSYEGYVQCLCANGHWFTVDAYDPATCSDCRGPAVWRNDVDDTNCDSVGHIRFEDIITWFPKTPPQLQTCVACGHSKLEAPPTFNEPTEEERGALQHYRIDQGSLVPINPTAYEQLRLLKEKTT